MQGVENNAMVNVKWVQTEKIKNQKEVENVFSDINGVLILLVSVLVVQKARYVLRILSVKIKFHS